MVGNNAVNKWDYLGKFASGGWLPINPLDPSTYDDNCPCPKGEIRTRGICCTPEEIEADTEAYEACKTAVQLSFAEELETVTEIYEEAKLGIKQGVEIGHRGCENQFDRDDWFYSAKVYACKRGIDVAAALQYTAVQGTYEAMRLALGLRLNEAINWCWGQNPCAQKS